MTKINDGGQVYPAMTFKKSGDVELGESSQGLTIRQYYAAKAMQGMFSNQQFLLSAKRRIDKNIVETISCAAFEAADAMIAAELTSADAQ